MSVRLLIRLQLEAATNRTAQREADAHSDESGSVRNDDLGYGIHIAPAHVASLRKKLHSSKTT